MNALDLPLKIQRQYIGRNGREKNPLYGEDFSLRQIRVM